MQAVCLHRSLQKKRRNILKSEKKIELDATSASQGAATIAKDEYDLYLVSPQTKMYFANLEKAAIKYQRPIVNIPPQAYVPIPMGIEKLAAVVEQNIK